ncbi:monocarboxylate transporter 12-like [Saccoglossus kowalevskii]|uniref:Monocarboxylate transporter 12-like n=1 Tax=Saccoglossus kowalevskii TaxID=10224 RepID=A0ABM0M6Z4_SACKO|nr:PREDICTED: monocarboxylate transporter 12-like [Saccoglossus kowalevskii]
MGVYTTKPPDGGWGWLVVAGTFIVYALSSGSIMSFGVIYVALLDAFGESRAKTALVGTLTYMVMALVNPYTGALSDRFGHRPVVVCGGVIASVSLMLSSFSTSLTQMYITFGVMTGLGYGCAHLVSLHIVSKYFTTKLPTATGIALSGSGFGIFLFSMVTQKLLDIYGWRGTLMVLSGMALNICVAGMLFRPLIVRNTEEDVAMLTEKRQEDRTEVEQRNFTTITPISLSVWTTKFASIRRTASQIYYFFDEVYCFSLLKLFQMYLLQLSVFLSWVAIMIMKGHVVKRAREFGIGAFPAASLVAVMGISQTIGRPLAGIIANQKGVNRLLFYQSSMALSGGCMIASIYADSYPGQFVLVIFNDIFNGFTTTLMSVLCIQYFGVEKFKYTYSLSHTSIGLAMLVGPALGGAIRDSTGAYVWTFYLGGFCFLFAAFIMCFMPIAGRCQALNTDNDAMRTTTSVDHKPTLVIVENETSV